MSTTTIWYFIKFFSEETHANQFMAGNLYLNTLAYFKQLESEHDDGRMDATEAVAMWLQPDDIVMKINVPKLGIDIEITNNDLAAPVSMSYNHHEFLHLFCLYAVHSSGFECKGGKFHCEPENAKELQRQLNIDERCFQFGKFAVITPAVPFLNLLKAALKSQGYRGSAKLVEYYDEEVFHGEIPAEDIVFRKQKRFSYQREFRLCVDTGTQQDAAITINIGDISSICAKVEAATLPSIFKLTPA
jgi:hypothetical protein